MRKFLCDPDTAAERALRGVLAQSRVELERVPGQLAVVHRGNTGRRVKVIVGGGSGHEPLFLGAVGPGMADAGVAGQVFAAPNPFAIQATAEACGAGEGIVFLYGNYSGDVLNFNFAVDEIEAEGGRAGEIRIHDDIASRPIGEIHARRGTAGDIFVIKCVSAAADLGYSFEEVMRIGEKVNFRTRSLGVALKAASSIETGEPMFDLPLGSMELGMGLHGELGVRRSGFEPAAKLVPEMVKMILADFAASGSRPGRVAVMVNGLGSTTVLELLVAAGHASEALQEECVGTGLFVTGEFATSLDMAGFSITLLDLDEELEPLLMASCESLCFSQKSTTC